MVDLTDDEVAAWMPAHLRPEAFLSGPQVCRAVGITYRQLDYWTRQGYIVPAVEASGSGSRRRYDHDTVRDLRLIVRLLAVADRNQVGPIAAAVALWRDAGRPGGATVGLRDGDPHLWDTPGDVLADLSAGIPLTVVTTSKETP